MMAWYDAALFLIGGVLLLMMLGMPVALAFLTINLVGALEFFGGYPGLLQVVDNTSVMIARFSLAPVPLFILMGGLFFHTGLALRVFNGLDVLLGAIPGRLAYLTVAGGAAFATLTGSSMANTAMLGSLMVPEMRKRGYSERMAMGPILGTGGLAMIIPPSTLAVILATIANIDVGRVLIAGLLPGLVLAVLYAGMIALQIRILPDAAPGYDIARTSARHKLRMFVSNVLPMGLILIFVVGFIVLGLTTPSEAAAFGVLGVVILAAAFRCMTWEAGRKAVAETVRVSGMVLFIMINSGVFSQLLAFSGASGGFLDLVQGATVAPVLVIVLMLLVLLVLGMFMDPSSMMLITIPVFFPIIGALGYDPIWFAVLMLMALEMSLTTPPFGMLLFITLGVSEPGTRLFRIAGYAVPFLFCDVVLIGFLILFPALALFLPGLMN